MKYQINRSNNNLEGVDWYVYGAHPFSNNMSFIEDFIEKEKDNYDTLEEVKEAFREQVVDVILTDLHITLNEITEA